MPQPAWMTISLATISGIENVNFTNDKWNSNGNSIKKGKKNDNETSYDCDLWFPFFHMLNE